MHSSLNLGLIAKKGFKNDSEVLEAFLEYLIEAEIELYPAQEEAILELFQGINVILNTPTGSGKSLVALAMHFYALSLGRRSMYTSPIKALVNEKFIALCKVFGPENVGLLTGDASVNEKAPIICCTAEILSSMALREGSRAVLHDVVMDEFHYYSDPERGMAWQIPLLTMSQCRFLLMSATLGDISFFETALSYLNNKKTKTVVSTHRPVPLDFKYLQNTLLEAIVDLTQDQKTPLYVVHFSQSEALFTAQSLMSQNYCTKEEKQAISQKLYDISFASPFGKDIKKYIQHGIGVHHAGLLPKYRILVEKLAQEGLLKVICGTDTLGVGINIPLKTVLFTKLCKYDGSKTTILSVREFHQISGRAGRMGFDSKGWIFALAPEHVVENLKNERKAALSQKKKLVKAKPPLKGFVMWTKETFDKLVTSPPERLHSRFVMSHALLLQVLGRTFEDGCKALKALIRDSHESDEAKPHHLKRGFELLRSLYDKKIVEIIPPMERMGTCIRVNIDLQKNFSMHQTLSLFLHEILKRVDPSMEKYDLAVLSLVESIIENPGIILKRQLDRIRNDKLAELKMSGMEYDERIAELEKLEYPKPLAEFIYGEFNRYIATELWVQGENIRPKSIAREMYEANATFNEYVSLYKLEKAEGVLLRYLSEVFQILVQTIPDMLKNDAIDTMILYFETMIKGIDTSMFDEWNKMQKLSLK